MLSDDRWRTLFKFFTHLLSASQSFRSCCSTKESFCQLALENYTTLLNQSSGSIWLCTLQSWSSESANAFREARSGNHQNQDIASISTSLLLLPLALIYSQIFLYWYCLWFLFGVYSWQQGGRLRFQLCSWQGFCGSSFSMGQIPLLTVNAGSACVSSIMRLYERIRVVHSLDGTFDMLNLSLWAYVISFVTSPRFFANWNRPRVAEIASGIICGCLPVAPKFFRHCEFIIKTRLLTYFQRRSPRRTLDSPLNVPNLKKPLGSWHNAPNLHLHRDNYVELSDYRGILTIVNGGTQAASSGASGLKCQKADDYEDVENANPGNQIRKTVRVEASD